jgi:hypothetical protein
MEEDEDYRNHFIECKEEGIPIYLDNSLHELKEAIGGDILIKWINILEPECVFIPDVWEDLHKSVVNARHWCQIQTPENTTKVAVVQANNLTDAGICYKIYKDLGYKKIAFSYGANYYKNYFPHINSNISQALGRVYIINNLYERKIINENDKIHLLGTACPFEFSLYRDMPFIDSIDTSNPIMATIDNIIYPSNGVINKPKSNMNNNFDIDRNKINSELLFHNIYTFKQLLK